VESEPGQGTKFTITLPAEGVAAGALASTPGRYQEVLV